MKKQLMIFYILLFLMSGLHSKEVITLAIGEWAPYTSSTEKNGKIAEHIVMEAFALEDIEVKYKYFPWKRARILVQRGDELGTFPWYKTPQRQKDFIFSKEAIMVSKTVFFHLKSLNLQWSKYEDLREYKIGATLGFYYTTYLNNQGLKVEEVPREEMNFKKMLLRRIDMVPSDFYVGYNIIYKLFTPQKAALFTNHPKAILHDRMYLLLSKEIPNAQKLANKFDKGLLKLKGSGRYDEIIDEFMFK